MEINVKSAYNSGEIFYWVSPEFNIIPFIVKSISYDSKNGFKYYLILRDDNYNSKYWRHVDENQLINKECYFVSKIDLLNQLEKKMSLIKWNNE